MLVSFEKTYFIYDNSEHPMQRVRVQSHLPESHPKTIPSISFRQMAKQQDPAIFDL